jgi:predicted dehydrogenase
MIKVGIIGFGLMGRTHFQAWQELEGAEVCALCDQIFADGKPLEDITGNIGSGESMDLTGIQLFTDCDKMFAECELDVVSIALPTFIHAQFTVKALEAGVHVLCEKPMGLNEEECKTMIAASEKSGKILQIGHCIRFWPEYIKAKELIDSGEYGKLLFGNFYRYSASPGWSGNSWFVDESRSGGMILDLHIHDTDYILHLLGMPESVSCVASDVEGVANHVQTQYAYKGMAISSEGSWAMSQSFGFRMGFVIGLEKATLEFNPAIAEGLQVMPFEGDKFMAELPDGTGYTNQIAHLAKKIRGEEVPEILTAEQSMQSIRVALAEKESIVSGKPVSLN